MGTTNMQVKLSEINDIISEQISNGIYPMSINVLKSKVKDLKDSMENEDTFNSKYENLMEVLSPKKLNPLLKDLYKDILLISPELKNVYRPDYMEYVPRILSSTYIVNDFLYNKSKSLTEDFVYSGILDDSTSKFIIDNSAIDIILEKSIDLSLDLSIDIANRIILIKDSPNSSTLLSEILNLSLEQIDVIKRIDTKFSVPEIYGSLVTSKSLRDDGVDLVEMSYNILKGGKQ